MTRPSDAVLVAFGASEPVVRLEGGQGTTFQSRTVILKPVSNVPEADWTAGVFARLEGPGFRVPRPIPSRMGDWVVDGWSAWELVPGEPAGRNGGRWPETLAACEAFHAAIAHEPRPAFLDSRTDPWSIADRMTWGEEPFSFLPEIEPIGRQLTGRLAPVDLRPQVIHGDFTANVLFADGLPPAVIDFSPYWRPWPFAAGIIAADALAWAGMPVADLGVFGRVPEFPQMLVRGALRRLLEFDQHTRAEGMRLSFAHELERHAETARIVGEVVPRR